MNLKTEIGHKELKETQRGTTELPKAAAYENGISLLRPEALCFCGLWVLCGDSTSAIGMNPLQRFSSSTLPPSPKHAT
ncbi:MAG: hypothetical protein HZA90_23545 [Verrucomicrobia bacterium]|nr:hypothetical protein [Verrucomicrobiota bacterium]